MEIFSIKFYQNHNSSSYSVSCISVHSSKQDVNNHLLSCLGQTPNLVWSVARYISPHSYCITMSHLLSSCMTVFLHLIWPTQSHNTNRRGWTLPHTSKETRLEIEHKASANTKFRAWSKEKKKTYLLSLALKMRSMKIQKNGRKNNQDSWQF